MQLPIVQIREGGDSARKWYWRQCQIISDDRVVIIDMKQAILAGWNFDRVTVQGHDDWCGMTAAQIIAFKRRDTAARPATDEERRCILEWLGDYFARAKAAAAA